MNQKQEQLPPIHEEFKGMLMLIVWVLHSSVLPLRLMSRVPGTVGIGIWFPSIFIGWTLMLLVPTLLIGADDRAVLPFWFGQIGVWLWLIHMIAYFYAHRKSQGVHSHCVGASWFNLVSSKGHPDTTAAVGDSMAAGLLAVLCFAIDAPSFALWWLMNIPLTFMATSIVTVRDAVRQTSVTSAAIDQKYWERMVKNSVNEGSDME